MNTNILLIVTVIALVEFGQMFAEKSAIYRGETLWPEYGILRAPRNKHGLVYEMVMQHDGNLVIYKKYNSKDYANPIWSTNTQFSPLKRPFHLKLQHDGNLVMYDMNKQVVWTSQTPGTASAYLKMQKDGNLVMYDRNGNPTWNSHSQKHMPDDC